MGPGEKCGIVGVYGNEPDVARLVYYGLWTLQHRGQESSGIASANGHKIYCKKGQGLVAHVYNEKCLGDLKGNIAIGHNRYATFGKASGLDHSQPVYQNQNTIALAHNGNIPVTHKLKSYLKEAGIPTVGLNDSEMIFKAVEHRYVKGANIEDSVRQTFPLLTGAFSLLIMTKSELVAIRDGFGIRPLCLGKLNGSYIFSSETCALDVLGAAYVRDVEPGEMVVINSKGVNSYFLTRGIQKLDAFEFIYFARPDSYLLGKNVYEVRKRLGGQLAEEVNINADCVIPVPDSSIPAGIGYSQKSGIPLEQALVKNRYIHRTFISLAQKQRVFGVQMKLNIISEVVRRKIVALVDDSIVRGTTSKRLVSLFRQAGAKEVHLLITSPPVKYPDFYGIDTPKQSELVASRLTIVELKSYLGVDSLHYLSYDGMIKAIGVSEDKLCTSCFTGEYPIPIGKNLKHIVRV